MDWMWANKMGQGRYAGDAASGYWATLRNLGGPSALQGYANLAQILSSQGRTDPAAFNMSLRKIAEGGQANQQMIDQQLAQRGWDNSGVGMALKQAAAGSTQNRLAAARAQELQTAEERKRSDLDLLLKLVTQPSIDAAAIASNQYQASATQGAAQSAARGAQMQALATLLAALM
jgi:hypothetical protein